MLSGFAFETAQYSLGVRDKGCIFCYFSHFFFFQICAPLRETGAEFRRGIINFFSHNDMYKDVHGILNTMQEVSNTGFHSFPLNTT